MCPRGWLNGRSACGIPCLWGNCMFRGSVSGSVKVGTHPTTPGFTHACSVISAVLINPPPLQCRRANHDGMKGQAGEAWPLARDGSWWAGPKSSGEALSYLFVCRYVNERTGNQRSSQTAAGEMGLSAAVLACCTVWKSSVMAYLMVIVQGGERLPCLHAGICVEAAAAALERREGDGESSLFFFFFLSSHFLHLWKQVVYGTNKSVDDAKNK